MIGTAENDGDMEYGRDVIRVGGCRYMKTLSGSVNVERENLMLREATYR